nr:immunoglobulin heavy chain junction region [Macaca mulatta]MOX65271.1 immunoglobulin heavy chain junction region [Macaca mulatta]MOX66026.1 immunoglobulin heavy chain junction region [Macaca mulatta]MOX67352.1 immunoglobulin heavy chain junction region [Macaca mulatta]
CARRPFGSDAFDFW